MHRMRRILATASAVCLLGGLLHAVWAAPLSQSTQPYTWRNVEIVGGGFVPGIIFNPTQRDLLYARTDIGGAYRWNPTARRWVPLTDFVSDAEYWLLGIESLATDPVDPNRVYAAAGAYLQSFAGNGAIFRSADQGNTWQRTDMPFKMGGNEPGRSIGERLMVDPNRNSILYFGTRNDGLWKSTDFGATWARVTSFPVTGQPNLGIGWVTFDKRTGTAGNATQTIYVGVVDSATPVYRSTNGGATWTPLAGQPNAGIPHHGVLASDGTLYLTYGDQPGPYTMFGGAVWKFNTGTSAWTNVTPLVPFTNGEQGFGYGGLAVDASNPNTVMVATMSRWGPVDDIFRSTNGGASWTSLAAHKAVDVSGAPFLNWDGPPNPKLGWMIGDLEIDPFNPGRILYGTGATIFGVDDITALDTGGTAHISVRAQGLEETAVQDLVSPPSGPPLISALFDIGGFRHSDLATVPPEGMSSNPIYGSETGLDFAERDPSFVVRVAVRGQGSTAVRASYSTDSGATWTPAAAEPANLTDGAGSVAVSADGSTILWSPNNSIPYFSRNRGASWTAVSGLATNIRVVSDRFNANKFYAWNGGSLYASSDGGATFTAKAGGLPFGLLRTVPGREGDIWLAGDFGGLYHSTDSGVTFTPVGSFTSAEVVGLGKAAPGQSYMAIYVVGVVNNVHGIYRSDDAGATWVRINDDQHQWGWIGRTITGDPRVYGRVYVATNGRGIVYGEPSGVQQPTNTPTRTPTPGSPTVTPTRTNTPPPVTATRTPTRTNTPLVTATRTPTRTNTPTGPTSTPTRTPTPGGGSTCSPVTATITAPFTFDGAGTFCWRSSNLGNNINSWNLQNLTVNGINFTNQFQFTSALPPKAADGFWYISYTGNFAFSHFEAK